MGKLYLHRGWIAVVFAAFIAGPLRAQLPLEAQNDVSQGDDAWKKKDYAQAVQHYEDALKIAPDAQEIYGHLGLADSEIPGRELRAICWYGAYLADNPGAPNATAVKAQIAALTVKSHSNCVLLIRAEQLAAKNLPTQAARDHGYSAVVMHWAQMGECAAAQKIAGQIVGGDDKSDAETSIVARQCDAGDFAGALKTAALIPSDYWKNIEEGEIAEAQAKAGDIAGAQKTAALVTAGKEKNEVNSVIAMAQAKADGLEAWKKQVELITDAEMRGIAEREVAVAQAKAGDLPAAEATFQIQLKNNEKETIPVYQEMHWQQIAIARARVGDIAGAQETTNLIKSELGFQEEPECAIAAAQAMAGDITGAQKTAAPIKSEYFKEEAGGYIAQAQAKALGNPPPPRFVVHLSEWRALGKYGLDKPLFLDPAGFLKTLPSDDPGKTFDALDANIDSFITCQAIVDGMLKKQAQQ